MANLSQKEVEIYNALSRDCPQEQSLPQKLSRLLGKDYAAQYNLNELADFYQISVLNDGVNLYTLRQRIKKWASDGNILPEDAFLLCYFNLPAGTDCLPVSQARQIFRDHFDRNFLPERFRQNEKDTIKHRKLLLREAVLHFSIYIGLSLTESYALYRRSYKCLGRSEMNPSSPNVYDAYRNLMASMPPHDKAAQQDSFCRFTEKYADQLKSNWAKEEGRFQLTERMRGQLDNSDFCERLIAFLEENPYNHAALGSVLKRVSAWRICTNSRDDFPKPSRYSSNIPRNELFLLCLFLGLDEWTAKQLITEVYGMKPTHPKRLFELLCDYAISMNWDEYDVYDFYDEYRLKVCNFVRPVNDVSTNWVLAEYDDLKEIAKESDKPEQMIYLHSFLTKRMDNFSEISKTLACTLKDIFHELEQSVGSMKAISDSLADTVDEFMECAEAAQVCITLPNFKKISRCDEDLLFTIEHLRKYQSGQKEITREHLLWLILTEKKRTLSQIIKLLDRCGFYPLTPQSNAFDWIFCRLLLDRG